MRKLSKLTVFLVCIALLLGGCVKTTGTPAEDSSEDEPYVIKLLSQGDPTRAYDPEKDVQKADIEKALNVKFNAEFVDYTQIAQKLGLMISSGDMPDIMSVAFATDFKKYAANGIFYEITDKLGNTEYLKDALAPEIWNDSKLGGKIYGIPSIYGLGVGYRYALTMRTDILSEMGRNNPQTLDEYYKLLKDVKSSNPNIIPLSAVSSVGTISFATAGFDHIFGAFNVVPGTFWQSEGKFASYDTDPRMKEALLFLRKMYSEGLIDKEFLTLKESNFKDKLFAGNVFSFNAYWANVSSWDMQMEQAMLQKAGSSEVVPPERANEPFKYIAPFDPIAGTNGKSTLMAPPPFASMICISAKTKNPERLLEILDLAHREDNIMLFASGIEGEDYIMEGDTMKPGSITVDPNTNLDPNGNYRERGRYNLVTMEKGAPHFLDGSEYRAKETIVKALYNPWQIFDAANYLDSESMVEYQQELNTLRDTAFSKIIMGNNADSVFDDFVRQWNDRGGAKIIEELEASYKSKSN